MQELNALNGTRTWWAEGICLYDHPDSPRHIFGDTKLFLVGYSTNDGGYREVTPRHDIAMAYRDGRFLVRTLWRVSQKHKLTWRLEIEGELSAVIQSGSLPRSARLQLFGLAVFARIMARSPSFWLASRWLSQKYADRWA